MAWTYIGRDQEKGKVFSWQDIHLDMADLILSGESVLIIVPSGHGKTNLVLGLKACKLGRNSDLRMAMVFQSEGEVTKRVGYMRQIMEGPHYRAIYPHFAIDVKRSDRQSGFYLKRDFASVEPSVEGRSIQQKSEGIHPDELIIDDPHSRDAAYSEVERQSVMNAIDDTWVKRVNPGGQVIITLTRWHDGDAAGVIIRRKNAAIERGIKEGQGDLFARIKIYVRTVPFSIDKDNRKIPTASLWERRFPLSMLLAEQENNPIAFSRDRLGDPSDQGSQSVTKVNYYNVEHYTKDGHVLVERWLTMDPAISTQKEACFSGWAQIDLGYDKLHKPVGWIRDAGMIKKSVSDLAKFVREKFEANQIDRFLMESRGPIGPSVPLILNELGEYRNRVVLWPGMSVDKDARLKSVSMLFQNGLILFPGHYVEAEEKWMPQGTIAWLVDHVLRFSVVVDRDGVDALTQFLIYHRQFFITHAEKKSEEEKRPRDRAGRMAEYIRSQIDTEVKEDAMAEQETALMECL